MRYIVIGCGWFGASAVRAIDLISGDDAEVTVLELGNK